MADVGVPSQGEEKKKKTKLPGALKKKAMPSRAQPSPRAPLATSLGREVSAYPSLVPRRSSVGKSSDGVVPVRLADETICFNPSLVTEFSSCGRHNVLAVFHRRGVPIAIIGRALCRSNNACVFLLRAPFIFSICSPVAPTLLCCCAVFIYYKNHQMSMAILNSYLNE